MTNPRSITEAEEPFLPADLQELAEVRALVLDAGYPSQVANGICSWLMVKALGGTDDTAQTTRSRYRRILREVNTKQPTPRILAPAFCQPAQRAA